jgi:DNA-binding NtrC family response regulator
MSKAILPVQLVLVVEDDQLLKSLTTAIVEEAGFVVLSADNADEALLILASRSDIAILLTDVNMPGTLDGLQLAHVVSKRWPQIKIVVVSGRGGLSAAQMPAGGLFFPKPYQAEAMISAFESLIDGGNREFAPRVA